MSSSVYIFFIGNQFDRKYMSLNSKYRLNSIRYTQGKQTFSMCSFFRAPLEISKCSCRFQVLWYFFLFWYIHTSDSREAPWIWYQNDRFVCLHCLFRSHVVSIILFFFFVEANTWIKLLMVYLCTLIPIYRALSFRFGFAFQCACVCVITLCSFEGLL